MTTRSRAAAARRAASREDGPDEDEDYVEEDEEDEEDGEEEDDDDDDAGASRTRGRARHGGGRAASTSQSSQGTAASSSEAPPGTKAELMALLREANTRLPAYSTKRWTVTGSLDELSARVREMQSGAAPRGSARGRRAKPKTPRSASGSGSAAPASGSKPLAPEVVFVGNNPRLVLEGDMHEEFEAPLMRTMLTELCAAMSEVVGEQEPAAEQSALLLRRMGGDLFRVAEAATNELLPPDAQLQPDELTAFLGTALALGLFNGAVSTRFEFVRRLYSSSAYAFLSEERFNQVARALSVARESDMSGNDTLHPSRYAEAFAAADEAVERGMGFLTRGLTRVTLTIDDDVVKNRTKNAASYGAHQMTARKGQALGTDAISLTLGVPVAINHAKPPSVSEASTAPKAQWHEMLMRVVYNRREGKMWIAADRGFMSMPLLCDLSSASGVNSVGPLTERARSGVYLVRSGTKAKFVPTETPAPNTSDFWFEVLSGVPNGPAGMLQMDYNKPMPGFARGKNDELVIKTYNVGGDRTVLAGVIKGQQFVGNAIVTEHGTARSSTNFATPFALSCHLSDAKKLASTYVGIKRRSFTDWAKVVFVPQARSGSQDSVAGRFATMLSELAHAVRPGSATDGTPEWHALHEFGASGTAMVGARRGLEEQAADLVAAIASGDPASLDLGVDAAALQRIRAHLSLRAGETDESVVAAMRGEEDAERQAQGEVEFQSQDDGLDGDGREEEGDESNDEAGLPASDVEEVAAPPSAAPSAAAASGAAPTPASSSTGAESQRTAVLFKRFFAGWFREHVSTRGMVQGKLNEKPLSKWAQQLPARRGPGMGCGIVGLGLSTLVPGVAATPDGIALERVQTAPEQVAVKLVLDEFKTKTTDATEQAAREVATEFSEHQFADPSVPVPLFSAMGGRAVPSVGHRLQLATQMLVWRVPRVRYTVASVRGVLYSVLVSMDDAELRAFEVLVRRVVGQVLAPLAPLYAADDSLDNPNIVRDVAQAVLAKYGAWLTSFEFEVLVSRLPRAVALRRAMPRPGLGEPALHTLDPLHAIKGGVAWWYNINKGGVDRMTEHVLRVLGNMEFMAHHGFARKLAMRRLLQLVMAALQLTRVRAASASFRSRTRGVTTFRHALANSGNIINEAAELGLALVHRRLPVLGAAPAAPADALVSVTTHSEKRTRVQQSLALLEEEGLAAIARGGVTPATTSSSAATAAAASSAASASSAGSVGSGARDQGSIAEAVATQTPTSAGLTALEMLAQRRLIKPGVTARHHQLAVLSASRAVSIATAVEKLCDRERAPGFAQFDFDPMLKGIRLATYLDHRIEGFARASSSAAPGEDGAAEDASASSQSGSGSGAADVRCKSCATRGSKNRTRARGRCFICGVALCASCFVSFHCEEAVTAEGAAAAMGKPRALFTESSNE